MSYILDALKKAQAEESPDGRAALMLELKDRSRQRRWQYLLFTALLLNAGVLVYLFGPWSPGEAPTSPMTGGPELRTSGPVPETTPATSEPAPAESHDGSGAANRMPPRPAPEPARAAASEPTPVATREPVLEAVNLSTLPTAARARFPDLSFSTHLYASDADLRAVVMNGKRLTEGERYGELELEEITETGVVLRFERYLVTVPVLDDWQ